MKIKQLINITNDHAVLATTAEHYKELCYDRKLDDYNYFWALLGSGMSVLMRWCFWKLTPKASIAFATAVSW